jgi:hypothetical protein|eukprot:COSAG02_NODE_421_length_22605_cov_158.841198_16_plen_98_part_00
MPGYYYDSNSKYYWNPETSEWYYQDSSGNFVQAQSGAGNNDEVGGKIGQVAQQQPASTEEPVSEAAKGHRYLHATLFLLIIAMSSRLPSCHHARMLQ